ncbi:MAG: EamA/RhaT family transporter [Nevskia sp.]|nr:EamA/RhaT family transporter [Nevskia sp.]
MPAATRYALPGLVLGAVLIGFAPIFVRLADVGPTAAAFWRVFLALPVLAAAQRATAAPRSLALQSRDRRWLWLAGFAFAADLALWHRSLHLTSVANSTLLCNLSPVLLALTLHFGFGEKQAPRFWFGLALALLGAGWLVADSLRIDASTAIGDLLAVGTAAFYAVYQLLVSRQRRNFSVVEVMLWSSLASACLLLPLTLLSGESLWPQSLQGWCILAGLALVSHIGGQGLIAWAMAHLSAAFSSVTLLVQPVAAAVFAWAILGERFGLQQLIGGVVVLAGIVLCRWSVPQWVPAATPAESPPLRR